MLFKLRRNNRGLDLLYIFIERESKKVEIEMVMVGKERLGLAIHDAFASSPSIFATDVSLISYPTYQL